MITIKANIGSEPYKIEIKSPSGNVLIADEPLDNGGQNKGFSPKELLASSLAACTCATLSMYAKRKEWDLEKVDVMIELQEEEGLTKFIRKIELSGNLEADQRERLLKVANVCPVHKILSGTSVIETTLH